MEMNGGFLVTKIKQLGDRIFEKILSEKNIDAFNGAQGRILYVLWQEDKIPIRSLSTKCGLAITSLTTMLERMENQGLISQPAITILIPMTQQPRNWDRLKFFIQSHSFVKFKFVE